MSHSTRPSLRPGLLVLVALLFLLAGCGTFRSSARGGSGMTPRIGTTFTMPLGK